MCKTFLRIYLNWPPRENCKRLLIWNLKRQHIGQVHVRLKNKKKTNWSILQNGETQTCFVFNKYFDIGLEYIPLKQKRLNVLWWWLVSLVPGELFAPDVILCPLPRVGGHSQSPICLESKTWKHWETTICAKL